MSTASSRRASGCCCGPRTCRPSAVGTWPQESYRPDGYNRYFFDAFLHPCEQTAALCSMRWLPPLVLHGAHRIDKDALAAHATLFAQRLASWPDWPEIAEMDPAPLCDVPADARPVVGAAATP